MAGPDVLPSHYALPTIVALALILYALIALRIVRHGNRPGTGSPSQIMIDTCYAFSIEEDIAREYLSNKLSKIAKQLNIGEQVKIKCKVKFYYVDKRRFKGLKNLLVEELIKKYRKRKRKRGGNIERRKRAVERAIGLALAAFRYGCFITKPVKEGVYLAREYDGTFKARKQKNAFARWLVNALHKRGYVRVRDNRCQANFEKLVEEGVYSAKVLGGIVEVRREGEGTFEARITVLGEAGEEILTRVCSLVPIKK